MSAGVRWAGPVADRAGARRRRARRRSGARRCSPAVRSGPPGSTSISRRWRTSPGPGSFMAADEQDVRRHPARWSDGAVTAFARGLADARGRGRRQALPGNRPGDAATPTRRSSTIRAEPAPRSRAIWRPFRAAIGAGVPIVMISNASYPALDSKPAPWSPRIQSLLRHELGFEGVTITDALDGAAATRGRTLPSVAVLVRPGGSRPPAAHGERGVERRRLRARRRPPPPTGRIPAAALRRSYDRILALKQRVWLRARWRSRPRSLPSDHIFRRLT